MADGFNERVDNLFTIKAWDSQDSAVKQPHIPIEFRTKTPISSSDLEKLQRLVHEVKGATLISYKEESVDVYKISVECSTIELFLAAMFKLDLRIRSLGLRDVAGFKG